MVSLTLSVSGDLKKRMARHRDIKWSELVRSVIEQQLDEIEEADRLMATSKLTEKDVEELAAMVDAGMVKQWRAAVRAARG